MHIGEKSSVWYGATLLGGTGIRSGNNCVIQDRVHISHDVNIGDSVLVGPNATIQGSELQKRAFVAMGASVRHSTVESGGFVAAGATVDKGAVVRDG